MSLIQSFAAYANTFEKAYETGDWSLLEPHFTEDAVYDVGSELLGPPVEGRKAIFEHFDESTRRLDRCFETRSLNLLEGPIEKEGSVWIRGTATYTAAAVPDFVLELEETAHFDGERITRLEDRFTPEMEEAFTRYVREHGAAIGLSLDE